MCRNSKTIEKKLNQLMIVKTHLIIAGFQSLRDSLGRHLVPRAIKLKVSPWDLERQQLFVVLSQLRQTRLLQLQLTVKISTRKEKISSEEAIRSSKSFSIQQRLTLTLSTLCAMKTDLLDLQSLRSPDSTMVAIFLYIEFNSSSKIVE